MDTTRGRCRASGFTIMEVLVTMVVSSVVFITIGVMGEYTQKSWERSVDSAEADEEYKMFQKTLEHDLRLATTKPAKTPFGVSVPQVYQNVSGALLFYTDDPLARSPSSPDGTIYMHRVEYNSSQKTINYNKYYATTTPLPYGPISYPGSPSETIYLKGVTAFTIPTNAELATPAPNGSNTVEVGIDHGRVRPGGSISNVKQNKIKVKTRYKEMN